MGGVDGGSIGGVWGSGIDVIWPFTSQAPWLAKRISKYGDSMLAVQHPLWNLPALYSAKRCVAIRTLKVMPEWRAHDLGHAGVAELP